MTLRLAFGSAAVEVMLRPGSGTGQTGERPGNVSSTAPPWPNAFPCTCPGLVDTWDEAKNARRQAFGSRCRIASLRREGTFSGLPGLSSHGSGTPHAAALSVKGHKGFQGPARLTRR
jgi:hypothetical protein